MSRYVRISTIALDNREDYNPYIVLFHNGDHYKLIMSPTQAHMQILYDVLNKTTCIDRVRASGNESVFNITYYIKDDA